MSPLSSVVSWHGSLFYGTALVAWQLATDDASSASCPGRNMEFYLAEFTRTNVPVPSLYETARLCLFGHLSNNKM